jgi:nucleoside-diphosphate-sugar epimerase
MSVDLTGQCVALVGGAGFIGHHLALALKRAGADVHVVDGLQVNSLGAHANTLGDPNAALYVQLIYDRLALLRAAGVPLHVLDARDYHALSRCLGEIKPGTIVQLAAVAHANRANKDPYSTFDHSLRTLENALDCARDGQHFIYFSSSMVYGDFNGQTATEDQRCEPLGIYGNLKYGGERLVIAYQQVFGMPYTIVRPSALYGERCVSRRVGQAFIEGALRGATLTIDGDGTGALDFTYIEDLVRGLILCIAREAARNEVFNLTYGFARSLNQLIGMVREHFPGVRVEYQPRRERLPERGTLSIDKARRLLGYEPAFPLEQGLARYVAWYKDLHARNPEYFKP